jgi:hypothetical protein
MKNVRTVENVSLPRQQIPRSYWTRHPHLRDLPISEFDEQPMILIGQDNINLTVEFQLLAPLIILRQNS